MSTPIRTPFTALTTAAEIAANVDLSGRRAIVTGGAAGIGLETARVLAFAGAEVTLAVRNLAAGQQAAGDIGSRTGGGSVSAARLDLADLASVRAFAAAWDGPLHILVNNAGLMACPETRTQCGWELQFATNYFGHFALSAGLHRALSRDGSARIVSVSSVAHLRSTVVLDDPHFHHRRYEPWSAYGQSKTANILFAVEADRLWSSDGIRANALHPGGVETGLRRYLSAEEARQQRGRPRKSVQQGAATSVLLAASPLADNVGGRYFEDCNEALANHPGEHKGVAPYAVDADLAIRLWKQSEQLFGSP